MVAQVIVHRREHLVRLHGHRREALDGGGVALLVGGHDPVVEADEALLGGHLGDVGRRAPAAAPPPAKGAALAMSGGAGSGREARSTKKKIAPTLTRTMAQATIQGVWLAPLPEMARPQR